MHQIQVHIIQPQALQAQVQILLYTALIRAPQLRRHENILALHLATLDGGCNSSSDFILVAIAVGRINVSVATVEGVLNSLCDFAGRRLPGTYRALACRPVGEIDNLAQGALSVEKHTETKGRNFGTCVEGEMCLRHAFNLYFSRIYYFKGASTMKYAVCGKWAV